MSGKGKFTKVFLNHYQSVLGEPEDIHTYGSETLRSPFCVGLFKTNKSGARLLLTAGISDYEDKLGEPLEIITFVAGHADEVEDFLIAALHFAISQKIKISEGFSLQGLSALNPKLASETGKEAIYFTRVRGVPPQLCNLPDEISSRAILLGFLISNKENEYFLDNGPEAFEKLIGEEALSFPTIERPSAL
jgi:hypothetical protein